GGRTPAGIATTTRSITAALAGELEVRAVVGAVGELRDELAAGAGERRRRRPRVVVLVGRRVVLQPARGRRGELFDRGDRRLRVAGDRLRARVAGVEDREALLAAQRELHRHRAAR